jgi:hypothetical protein
MSQIVSGKIGAGQILRGTLPSKFLNEISRGGSRNGQVPSWRWLQNLRVDVLPGYMNRNEGSLSQNDPLPLTVVGLSFSSPAEDVNVTAGRQF